MHKIRVSTIQGLMLEITSITVTGHLLFIPVVLNHAGRDAWMSLIVAFFAAQLIGLVVTSLARQFPGRTLIEYAEVVCGKWLGRLLAALFIFYFYHHATISIRGFGEFFTIAITPNTPILVYFIAILFLAGYAVRSNLEVLARTNQIFLVVMILVGITASILTHKDKDYSNFLPLLEFGPQPMLMGALSLTALYSTFILVSMVLPYVEQQSQLKRAVPITMAVLIVMFLGPLTGPIAVYGPERSIGISFPTFQLLRDIQVGALQRLDVLGILLWSLGSFGKVSMLLYATCLGLAQLLRLRDYRPLVIPVAALMSIGALVNSENFIELYRFLRDAYPYYSTFMGLVLPLLLLVTARIRRKKLKRSDGGDDDVQETAQKQTG